MTTELRHELMIRMAEEGISQPKIARVLGVSQPRVCQVVRRARLRASTLQLTF